MRYINSTKGGLIALIFFSFLAFIIPGRGSSSDNIDLILTITTFLFAILAGFFIARANTRFSEMKRTIAEEDALILSLYKTSQIYGKRFSNKISDLIDKYYIASYDKELSLYAYKEGIPYFLSIWDEVIKVKKLKIKNEVGQDNLIQILTSIEKSRNLTSEISKEKVGRGKWIILLILTAIIIFCLFSIKTPDINSITITALLSTSLVIVLLILRDLRNLKFGSDESFLGESGQEVLESIGKLRYFNDAFLKKKYYSIPEYIKEYRVGYHVSGEKHKIKIIKNNRKRKFKLLNK